MKITLKELRTLVKNVLKEEMEGTETSSEEQVIDKDSQKKELGAKINSEYKTLMGNAMQLKDSFFNLKKNGADAKFAMKNLDFIFKSLNSVQTSNIALKMSVDRMMETIQQYSSLNEAQAWKGFDASIYDNAPEEDESAFNTFGDFMVDLNGKFNAIGVTLAAMNKEKSLGTLKTNLPKLLNDVLSLNTTINDFKQFLKTI
jgi:hypothetical protein